MGKGSWVENGSGNKAAPLDDWQPPKAWKVGAHAKHLRNLYIYFWRWAAWKVFEQGAGGRDKEPPVAEKLSGMVCYITATGFLGGDGFMKMRSDLRRDCNEIWIVDCWPEGIKAKLQRAFSAVCSIPCASSWPAGRVTMIRRSQPASVTVRWQKGSRLKSLRSYRLYRLVGKAGPMEPAAGLVLSFRNLQEGGRIFTHLTLLSVMAAQGLCLVELGS